MDEDVQKALKQILMMCKVPGQGKDACWDRQEVSRCRPPRQPTATRAASGRRTCTTPSFRFLFVAFFSRHRPAKLSVSGAGASNDQPGCSCWKEGPSLALLFVVSVLWYDGFFFFFLTAFNCLYVYLLTESKLFYEHSDRCMSSSSVIFLPSSSSNRTSRKKMHDMRFVFSLLAQKKILNMYFSKF